MNNNDTSLSAMYMIFTIADILEQADMLDRSHQKLFPGKCEES